MKTRNLVFVTLVLATALGAASRSLANPPACNKAQRAAATRTPLADDIQRWVDRMRGEALRRWFAEFNDTEIAERDRFGDRRWDDDFDALGCHEPGFGHFACDDTQLDEGWWDKALGARARSAVVRSSAKSAARAQTAGTSVAAAASGEGTAISLVRVDGHYEIEAAYAGPDGTQRFRTRGSQEQVEQWAAQLPPPLRQAVQRRLGIVAGEDCTP